ncbi:MAG TPA: hypothetical protein VLE97_11435 [Gaiellaceae bacterium]|nr:hypothetical protein [Gaiellaceae bacterium]
MSLFEQILAAFGSKQGNVNDLPADDPTAKIGKTCEALFTGGVDTLRSIIPSDRIQSLGRVVWDLVGHKQVLVALGPEVPSLTFTVMGYKGHQQGVVLVPKDWPTKVEDDPFLQLGAIVFVGAQIVDFYNDRLVGDPTSRVRSYAYEAELLHALAGILASWSPNEYQRELMKKYPSGLDSSGVELYPFKAFVPTEESA